MLKLRSLAYNIAFYATMIAQMIIWTPFYFLAPRRYAWYVPKFWARNSIWMLEKIAGTKVRIEGQENLPNGAFILAPKHQSLIDILALVPIIADPFFILKRELMWIPLFGWYVGRMNMVPVKRGDRARALRDVVAKSTERLGQGRELLIYPEGTRRPPGAEPAYKYGIVELYARLGVPVVPIAHQAGLFWPRRKMVRHPGTIVIRILPPIPPGLAKEEFQSRLVSELEAASDAILVETAARPGCPPLPSTARARLATLKAAAN